MYRIFNHKKDRYNTQRNDITDTMSSGTLNDSLEKFTAKLCKSIIPSGSDNVVFSPISIYIAFAMLLAGASGEQKKIILTFLEGKSSRKTIQDISKFIGHYELLKDTKGLPILNLSNSVWVSKKSEVKTAYIDTITSAFHGMAKEVDFGDMKSGAEISQWLNDATNGKIDTQISVTSDMIMLLLNAIYFKSAWDEEFIVDKKMPFHNQDGTDTVATFLKREEFGFYRKLSGCSIVQKRLDPGYTASFVLPDKDKSIDMLIENGNLLRQIIQTQDLEYTDIALKIPRFGFSRSIAIKNYAKSLGIERLMNAEGYKEIADGPIEVSQIIHECKVKVDEDGFEGAACTSMTVVGTGIPKIPEKKVSITLDRPFLFLIKEGQTCIFMGVMRQYENK